MVAEYIYCPHCGYEAFDQEIGYSAIYAKGSFYICPNCGEETNHVTFEDNE
jgi:DNA-directed RNA polymerase subunit RPC12/RpoP